MAKKWTRCTKFGMDWDFWDGCYRFTVFWRFFFFIKKKLWIHRNVNLILKWLKIVASELAYVYTVHVSIAIDTRNIDWTFTQSMSININNLTCKLLRKHDSISISRIVLPYSIRNVTDQTCTQPTYYLHPLRYNSWFKLYWDQERALTSLFLSNLFNLLQKPMGWW